VGERRIGLSVGPRENGHRPAVDATFRSAARAHRQRTVGVVLSGLLDDGAAGLYAIKARGGTAVVQDPMDALAPSMPLTALKAASPAHCLPAREIGPLLVKLADTKVKVNGKRVTARGKPGGGPVDPWILPRDSQLTALACPECQGALFEAPRGQRPMFVCHVGHRFSPEGLSEAHLESLERALWIAVRTIRERAAIQRTLAERTPSTQRAKAKFEESAAVAEKDLELIKEILERI
jgi:two-component system, chemotaxis family, protein-glutamate methylesterase/glutaminase